MTIPIKLALSGSGTLYPCFVGAILRLSEAGYKIEEVCGTSGGSIVAAALGSGYKPNQELVRMVKDTLPAKNKLIDISMFSLFFNWGLVKGEKVENVFNKYFCNTLGETKIPTHIVTADLEKEGVKIFSSKTDPHISLPKAVRASISIPGVFAPVKIGNSLFVDGGIAVNFGIDAFGKSDNVIGIRFESERGKGGKISSVKDYIMSIVNTTVESNMQESIQDVKSSGARIIYIKTKFGGLDFNIDDSQCDQMIAEGYSCVDKWIRGINT